MNSMNFPEHAPSVGLAAEPLLGTSERGRAPARSSIALVTTTGPELVAGQDQVFRFCMLQPALNPVKFKSIRRVHAKTICARIGVVSAALLIAICQMAFAQDDAVLAPPGLPAPIAPPNSVTLFQNVRIFDGHSATLSAPSNVLVKGNIIERISTDPIPADANVTVIAGNGRTLMPGLIDAHWHMFMAAVPQPVLMTADPHYLLLLATRQAEATLMRGFTTVRDLEAPPSGSSAQSTRASSQVRESIPPEPSSHRPPDMETFASPSRFRGSLEVLLATQKP